MKTLIRSIVVGAALLFSLTLRGQMESSLTYRRYVTQDGLPQMQAERLWQDSRGYIYIGTLSGFVRFDGRSFTPFLKGRRQNIVGFIEVDDEVRALGFLRQWRVDYDDIEQMPLDPKGHWLLNNLNAGSLPNGYVLLEDSLEQHRRLCRMTKRGMEPMITDSLLDEMTPDRKLYLDTTTGDVIAPMEKGVFLFRKGSGKAVQISHKSDVFTLLRTDAGLLAFASDGIFLLGSDSLTQVVQADWQATSYGLTVRQLRSGCLVIADEHSLYLCDVPASPTPNGQCAIIATGINLIRDVMVDRWDRLWVATYQGVYCFFNRCFTCHQLTDRSDIVRAVAADYNGRMVMGTLNGKVMADGRLLSDDPSQFYASSAVSLEGKVYMAGNGDVACVEGDSVSWLGLPRDRYQFVGKAWGKVIMGTRTGIYAYDPQTEKTDTLTTAILHPWCAVSDSNGLLWIGSSSGLFSIDKTGNCRKTEYADQKLIVSAMDADTLGNVFFASADSVFVVRKGSIEALNAQMPMLNGHEVRSVHVSPRGYLVVAVVDGLFVCRIDKECRPSGMQFFDHQNGFTMTEPLKAVMAETGDGMVWLPGIEQMMSFRPAELLAMGEEDTYISPPLRWWQYWWVWLIGIVALMAAVWRATRWYEKRRARQRMIRLQREKLQREEQIEAIRQKAIEEVKASALAKDIVKMTENAPDERITLRTASGTIVADVKDIAYFKGDGNYSQIVTFHDTDTVLIGLGALTKMLSPETFVRADRSTLVNIHHVYRLLPKQRRCIFRSPTGQELETILLAPAFKRLQDLLDQL